eukprot:1133876-Prymnesium_polylepis.1
MASRSAPKPAAKGSAASRKRKATVLDSSDEEQSRSRSDDDSSDEDDRRAPKRSEERRFDKDNVLAAVMELQKKAPDMLPAERAAEWKEWHASVPTQLSQVAAAKRPLPLLMPMKCAAEAAAPARQRQSEQQQLLTYRNPDGQSYTTTERARDALVLKCCGAPLSSSHAHP